MDVFVGKYGLAERLWQRKSLIAAQAEYEARRRRGGGGGEEGREGGEGGRQGEQAIEGGRRAAAAVCRRRGKDAQ